MRILVSCVAKVTIDVPNSLVEIIGRKNILLMGLISAVLISRLIESTIGREELTEEDLETIMRIDELVKESILKHYQVSG